MKRNTKLTIGAVLTAALLSTGAAASIAGTEGGEFFVRAHDAKFQATYGMSGEKTDGEGPGPVDPGTPEPSKAVMEFNYNCQVTSEPVIPVNAFEGKATWTIDGKETVINAKTVKEASNGNLAAKTNATLKLDGTFGNAITMGSANGSSKNCLRAVTRWDQAAGQTTAKDGFKDATGLQSVVKPSTTITDMSNMFQGATNYSGAEAENWDVSGVENMKYMFFGANLFNGRISEWNTGKVADMSYMFNGTSNFNQDLSKWETGNVTNMAGMFANSNINSDLSKWDVAKVTDMNSMFAGAQKFANGGAKTLPWNAGKVKNMSYMFANAGAFDADMSGFKTGSAENFEQMFYMATSFKNGGAANLHWNTSSAYKFDNMFGGAAAFNANLDGWNVSNAWNFNFMFNGAKSFNNGGKPMNWNVTGVPEFTGMFEDAASFNQDISSWNVSQATGMEAMFRNAKSFNNGGKPLGWDTASVGDMNGMFHGAGAFDQDISGWKVDDVRRWYNFHTDSGLSNGHIPAKLVSYAGSAT